MQNRRGDAVVVEVAIVYGLEVCGIRSSVTEAYLCAVQGRTLNFAAEVAMEQEIQRIWILVSELSEQLVQNNRVAADLHTQIQTLKVGCCFHAKQTRCIPKHDA